LETKASHKSFSVQQHENWSAFCHAVGDCDNLESLSLLIDDYLELTVFEEDAFFTGYYEPTLKGSMTPSSLYSIPLYKEPNQLVNGKPIQQTFSRKQIREGALTHLGCELVYVSDAVDAFFLEIQGSGRIEMEDGSVFRVGYAGQNGFPYTPIGRALKEKGCLDSQNITMQSIKAWLRGNPEEAFHIMDLNESYVFFKEILKGEPPHLGPLGTQRLPLTSMMSVACDAEHWPFGMILIYDLKSPSLSGVALTQDTGGAIKGPLRFDLFCGFGKEAEEISGSLKTQARVCAYLPKTGYPI